MSSIKALREIKIRNVSLEEILTLLEQKEAEYINAGNYDFYVRKITQPSNILCTEDLGKELGLTATEIEAALDELASMGFVIKLINEKGEVVGYRSRTAEVVRLIYHVKQRFWDAKSEPRLVEDVKWIIEPRYGLIPEVDVNDFVSGMLDIVRNELGTEFGDGLDKTCQIIQKAMVKLIKKIIGEKLYRYQVDGAYKILENLVYTYKSGKRYGEVIVAGTGLGKTETYMLPMLLMIATAKLINLRRRARGEHEIHEYGALVIFPRFSLSINQFARYAKAVYYLNMIIKNEVSEFNIEVGIDNHAIPFSYDKLSYGRLESEHQYFAPAKEYWEIRDGKYYFKPLTCPICEEEGRKTEIYATQEKTLCDFGHELPIRLSKKDAYDFHFTNIVLTTADALSVKLTWRQFVDYVGHYGVMLVVIDEIHLLRELYGSRFEKILKRLDYVLTKKRVGRVYVGLSATIASPEYFFSELTGVKVRESIKPEEMDYERTSVVHYILVKPAKSAFIKPLEERENEENTELEKRLVKPLSTMIQVAMVTLHNAFRREGKNKVLVFTDSIDIIERLEHYIHDAEQRERGNKALFRLRDPEFIEKLEKGKCKYQGLCRKYNGALYTCDFYKSGECWILMRLDNHFHKLCRSNDVKVYYADRREELEGDLILATSALEVGYDDPSFIIMMHYEAPRSTEEFIQRKGRVGRSLDDRPLIILVLNPYRFIDNFYYSNPEYLLKGEYAMPLISKNNYYVVREAIKASVLDQIAFEGLWDEEHALSKVKERTIIKLRHYRNKILERSIDKAAKVAEREVGEQTVKNIVKSCITRLLED